MLPRFGCVDRKSIRRAAAARVCAVRKALCGGGSKHQAFQGCRHGAGSGQACWPIHHAKLHGCMHRTWPTVAPLPNHSVNRSAVRRESSSHEESRRFCSESDYANEQSQPVRHSYSVVHACPSTPTKALRGRQFAFLAPIHEGQFVEPPPHQHRAACQLLQRRWESAQHRRRPTFFLSPSSRHGIAAPQSSSARMQRPKRTR